MKFLFGETISFISDRLGRVVDIVKKTDVLGGLSTWNNERLATQSTLVGKDGQHEADIQLIDGHPSLRTFGIQAIESLRGFDPIPDTWFYIGNETNSSGAGAIGNTVRVQIAAGDVPANFPAVDLTYTLVAGDVGNEETLATNIASYLNGQASFNTLWRAQKISNSGCVYITSKKPGGQFERPNAGDFTVTATGTTSVTVAFDRIIRQNKITSLARDPADPRQGILGIQGSVVQTEGDVTTRFQTVFSNLLVNGSITPVDFTVPADASEVKFITSVVLSGTANGIKFGQFLSRPTLTNGIVVSFKSNDFSATRQALKTTDDVLDYHAEDPDNFVLYVQSGGDKFTAVLEFGSPLELRPQGEFSVNDFLKIRIQDDLTAGILSLRAIVSGFNREY
jgi:hypothetical protein